MATLLITELFPPKVGGSIRFYWEVYRRLPREHFLIAAGEHAHGEAFDRRHNLNVRRLPLTLENWGVRTRAERQAYGGAIGKLLRLVKAEGVGMMHCGRSLPEGVMALAVKLWTGVPYACYVWGEDINGARTSREYTWLVKRVLRHSACLITCSRNTFRLLVDDWGVAPERIHLLYPGVNTDRFIPAARDIAVRRRFGWGDRHVLLTVARLQKRKGHDRMIEALRSIRVAVPDVLYAIVGDGEERQALQALVEREGLREHVQFMGELDMQSDDLVTCYQQCDLFLLPNRQIGRDLEGFGMVMIEAQACGRPVVGGDCGGTPETVDAPHTGLILDCNRPDEITTAVVSLLSDPGRLSRMGDAARQWVVERFNWPVVARQASAIFQRGVQSPAAYSRRRTARSPAAEPPDSMRPIDKHTW